MTEKTVTENEIIKALTKYIDCQSADVLIADNVRFGDVLNLINSYKSENERLVDKLDEQEGLKDVQIEAIKAETMKDFADRLYHTLAMNGDDCFEVCEIEDYCADIIKELTEG